MIPNLLSRYWRIALAGTGFAVLAGLGGLNAQERRDDLSREQRLESAAADDAILHTDCSNFSSAGARARQARLDSGSYRRSRIADEVVSYLGSSIGSFASRTQGVSRQPVQALADGRNGLIDQHVFGTLQEKGVQPASKIDDYEFIRRASFDLTGRVPVYERVLSFAADKDPEKRAKLVDELLASPLWVDKWSVFLGDLFKNGANLPSTGTNKFQDGRDAFHRWLKAALTDGTSYASMARTLIAARGDNSYVQGELNWVVNGRQPNGPIQDTYDRTAAQTAETFLGLSHMDCVLCHDGRGHLDSLSLWGRNAKRTEAWGLAAYFSKTAVQNVRVNAANPQPYYWRVVDQTNNVDYNLNTTFGNRPNRQPIGTTRAITPKYPFSGNTARQGVPYRESLAAEITADPMFAMATVNYFWKEFFSRGLVDPVDQLDPARLDPDNPPKDCPPLTPCELQASHPRLLKELGQDFAASGFNLKDLMRKIVSSEAYQLSSRYEATTWNPKWEPLFARHLPRRLWGEEVLDSIVLASNVPQTFTVNTKVYNWAMQLPQPPGGFVAAFLPGNRDDEPRKSDAAVQQALLMMNDAQVVNRIRATGNGAASSLVQQAILQSTNDEELVNRLFLAILSRPPRADEKASALKAIQTGSGTRTDRASSLTWALFNKVDFIFNY